MLFEAWSVDVLLRLVVVVPNEWLCQVARCASESSCVLGLPAFIR